MEVKTGKRLQKSFLDARMFSAFIDGKKFLTLALSKVLGQKKRTEWFSSLSIKTDLKNGLSSLNIYQAV